MGGEEEKESREDSSDGRQLGNSKISLWVLFGLEHLSLPPRRHGEGPWTESQGVGEGVQETERGQGLEVGRSQKCGGLEEGRVNPIKSLG